MVGVESKGGYPSAMAPLILQVPHVPEVSPGPAPPLDERTAAALAEDFQKGASSLPVPDGMTGTVWEALCKRMLTDIHRNHTMTADEKEAALRHLVLPIPGKPPDRKLRVVEDPNGVYTVGATGAVLWPAAISLIQHLDETVPAATTGSGKRVVEFGAGLGCVGSFLKLYKGCRVILTDVSEALPLLLRNVTENFSTGDAPEVLPLCWGNADQQHVLSVCGAYDLVIGSDITYRPEYLDELLRCAHGLLRPGGRLVISAQDRPGEVQLFRTAISRTDLFRIILDDEAPLPRTGIEEGSTLEAGETRWGDSSLQAPDFVGQVLLLELEAKETQTDSATEPSPGMLCTLDDVEAEFERITGIRPDPELCAAMRSASSTKTKPVTAPPPDKQQERSVRSSEGSSRPSPSTSLKERLIKDFLDRGLGDLLCEQDEELAAAINAQRAEDRPRTDRQKRRIAEAYYAERAARMAAIPATSGSGAAVAIDSDAAANAAALEAIIARDVAAGHQITTCAAVVEPVDDVVATVEAPSLASADCAEGGTTVSKEVNPSPAGGIAESQMGSKSTFQDVAKVRNCLSGLEWNMDINKADKQLSVIVTFGDAVWEVLQGSSAMGEGGGTSTFREAVDFELSETVLRVTHHGAVVLELELPQRVDPVTAAAKLSSRQKRVTVRATAVC